MTRVRFTLPKGPDGTTPIIHQVRALRLVIPNLGLKDAKDMVERGWLDISPELLAKLEKHLKPLTATFEADAVPTSAEYTRLKASSKRVLAVATDRWVRPLIHRAVDFMETLERRIQPKE